MIAPSSASYSNRWGPCLDAPEVASVLQVFIACSQGDARCGAPEARVLADVPVLEGGGFKRSCELLQLPISKGILSTIYRLTVGAVCLRVTKR